MRRPAFLQPNAPALCHRLFRPLGVLFFRHSFDNAAQSVWISRVKRLRASMSRARPSTGPPAEAGN
jgi:hypothetical protein